jgi:type VI secretion system secreted protein Hcp
MAVSIFLDLTDAKGNHVDGECAVDGHNSPPQIDVYGWSWGMSQSGSMQTATGGGSGKVNVQDLHITKNVDKSSPVLMQYCCSGQAFNVANLILEKAGGETPVQYLKIEMDNAILSSYSTGASGGDDLIRESISFNFASYKLTYTPQADDGSALPDVSQGWNIAQNKAAS